MNTKTFIAGVLGGITYFLLGFLIYAVLLKEMTSNMGGTATNVMRADADIIYWALIIGNIGYGLAFAYILGSWSGVTTFLGGAKAAAVVAFLFVLGYDLSWYAVSNVMGLKGVCLDVVIFTFLSTIAGGVIGWWLGRSN